MKLTPEGTIHTSRVQGDTDSQMWMVKDTSKELKHGDMVLLAVGAILIGEDLP